MRISLKWKCNQTLKRRIPMQEHFHFKQIGPNFKNNMQRFYVLYPLNCRVSRFLFNVEIIICWNRRTRSSSPSMSLESCWASLPNGLGTSLWSGICFLRNCSLSVLGTTVAAGRLALRSSGCGTSLAKRGQTMRMRSWTACRSSGVIQLECIASNGFMESPILAIVLPKRLLSMGWNFICRSPTKGFRWDMSSPKRLVTTGWPLKPLWRKFHIRIT